MTIQAPFDQGLVFHQGLPVAIYPIAERDPWHLYLRGGSLGLEQGTPVSVALFWANGRSDPLCRVTGRLEETDRCHLTVRLDEPNRD